MDQSLLHHLSNLERTARQLEPGLDQFKAWLQEVSDYANRFLKDISTRPAYVMTADKGAGLTETPITETGITIGKALELLERHVDTPGLNPASGGHLGYIPGGGIVHSALADFLADITNRYAGVFFASPGAVRMENMLLRWMAGVVGYPQDSAGNLTSGGSIANLIGVVTARDAHALKARDLEKSVIYLSQQVHHSVDKALRIAGLRECPVRYISLDERFRMQAPALQQAIERDRRDGLNPWLVIASAGTTDTGAIDPLSEIGEIARQHGLWFHLDAAYGAFFALCDEGRELLRGMETSDSIVMDPHKGLFLPYGAGAVLVKSHQQLLDAHYYMPNYLQDTLSSRDELSPADLSPELTKHFRGLRLWLPLMLVGVRPFRAAVAEKLYLARYFYETVKELPGFEVGPYPDLSVVTYRYVPEQGDADEFNRKLVHEIHKDGRVFISSTILDGTFTLRLAVLAFRTHRETIDMTLEVLQEKVALLS